MYYYQGRKSALWTDYSNVSHLLFCQKVAQQQLIYSLHGTMAIKQNLMLMILVEAEIIISRLI